MLSFEAARDALLASATTISATESVPLTEAVGRILAADVVSAIDVPPADNSAMDGYAVRVAELGDGVLPVSQRIPAGSKAEPLQPGSVARIFTGAAIPPGADAVVMQERCEVDDAGVRVQAAPGVGENIRRRGEDIARGAVVLRAGERLSPAALGLAASIGIPRLTVYRRLRVATFFTGSELQEPGTPLAADHIYNSNQYMLAGLLAELGCEVISLGIVPDDLAATREALRKASRDSDLVLTCGGVSVGEEDHVKAAVEAEGALERWRVAIRPGKPLASGRIGETPFIGLPGNPVSSYVTFQMLVRPCLRRLQGMTDVLPRPLSLRAAFDWRKNVPVREFLRVRVDADGALQLFPNQGSAVLSSCAWAEGFVSNPPQTAIAKGDVVQFIPLGGLA
ncbi:molybdopterin-binding protein [Viridibacterium curvum]|uniref:Molybdopterin molybdenumtransferase n=1 Tax=Viridibacterium curvum TaxID=1101404 RepID=A0ABP9Q9T6_9RHOO